MPPPDRPAAPLLAVDNVTAGYHGVPVVRDITLEVGRGEVVALLGANGAGKTTTLSAVTGLIRPMAGTVRLAGADVTGRAPHRMARRGLSLVPEDRGLFPDLTTRENLRLARARRPPGGPGRRESGGAARRDGADDEVLDLLPELRKCLPRRAGLLSGGEQQMLAVGRALVRRPRLLVVDEMSLGLAPVVVERLLPVLRRAADEFGTGVLVVEQHVSLALEVARRAYVLAHGRLVLDGDTADLRDRRDLLMACYLGELNALEGER
jgi:branched-chain amino acid transport system ATP-binding protein